jgi:hypothetical protein
MVLMVLVPIYKEYAAYVGGPQSHPVKSCFVPTVSFSEATHGRDVVHWCQEHFGPGVCVDINTKRPNIRASRWGYWISGYATYFQQPDDAFQFKLRWC